MSDLKKYAIWIRQKLYERVNGLVAWMGTVKKTVKIYAPHALRLLFKAWDSLTEKQKLKLMEGE